MTAITCGQDQAAQAATTVDVEKVFSQIVVPLAVLQPYVDDGYKIVGVADKHGFCFVKRRIRNEG